MVIITITIIIDMFIDLSTIISIVVCFRQCWRITLETVAVSEFNVIFGTCLRTLTIQKLLKYNNH